MNHPQISPAPETTGNGAEKQHIDGALQEQYSTHADRAEAQATLITASKPKRLTKRWHMVDGEAVKDSAGNLIEGKAEPVKIAKPSDLDFLLHFEGVESNQALCFGVPGDGKVHPLVTQDRLPDEAFGAIARDNNYLVWPSGQGWMMLDYDPDQTPLARDELLAILYEAAPALKDAPMYWCVSGSSHIHNAETGEQVSGLSGQRLYILVKDARDIPRAGRALFDRLWLRGHGHWLVTTAGTLLERSVVDTCAWQPCRLDFVAPPVCEAPLKHEPPDPQVFNNEAPALDSMGTFAPLTEAETKQLAEIKKETRNDEALLTKQRETREAWVQRNLRAFDDCDDELRKHAEARLRASITEFKLWGDFELIHQTGEVVTVGEVMDNPDRWHGQRFADPLEPQYRNDPRIAWLNLRSGGRAYIYSHAHAGQRFTLYRSTQQLKLISGDLPCAVESVIERLRLDGIVYERAGGLVRLAGDELVRVEAPWLQTYLETCFQFMRYDARAKDWVIKDCPETLAKRVMSAQGDWSLPQVAGVISAPVMRGDGTILDKAGFDDATKLLFIDDKVQRPMPRVLSDAELQETLARIWEPFEHFPFDSDLSRSVFMAALLTTVCRAALPVAPGFMVRASTPSTGKTLLSECLMLLVGAETRSLPLPENDISEIEKRIFAKMLSGCEGMILDNLSGVVASNDLCSKMTSAVPEGRILGKSDVVPVINRALFVLNGNNVTAGGDLFRRVLPMTLDANTERPERRKFTFDPREVIKQRLENYRADLLSVLFTFQAQGAPRTGKGSLGSFEIWDSVVRQCICWLIDKGAEPVDMADPLDVLELSKSEDPHHQQHQRLLAAWFAVYGDTPVMVKQLRELTKAHEFSSEDDETETLTELLREVGVPRGKNEFDNRYFAGWLRRYRGKVTQGLRLERQDHGKAEVEWFVYRV